MTGQFGSWCFIAIVSFVTIARAINANHKTSQIRAKIKKESTEAQISIGMLKTYCDNKHIAYRKKVFKRNLKGSLGMAEKGDIASLDQALKDISHLRREINMTIDDARNGKL